MKASRFIASKMIFRDQKRFSRPAVRISILSITLGLMVMIISVAVVTGFREKIREKVIGFGGHIRLATYSNNNSVETQPQEFPETLLLNIAKIEGVKKVQVFATKAAIIRNNREIQGVVLKGVDKHYDWTFFRNNLTQGRLPNFTDSSSCNEILVSEKLANLLQLKLGDKVPMYFITEKNIRARAPVICGLYQTGLDEFDRQVVLGDIRHIQNLNGWKNNQVGGIEVLISQFYQLNTITDEINRVAGYEYQAQNISQLYPQIFEWLGMLDMNITIILALMVLVAGINIISIMLILLLEKTSDIGILKAIGASPALIRNIFLYKAAWLIGNGLFYGNIIGLGFCLLQQYTGLIKLNPETYYMSVVPISINIWHVLGLNLGTFFICMLILLIPSIIIRRISPVKAIRFS